MAIRSMTAFARAVSNTPEGAWGIEIRSLNHRYFEFSLKVPPALGSLENRIRDFVQASLRRGKVTVSLMRESASGEAANRAVIDESAVRFYAASVKKLKRKFRLGGDLSVSDLLRLPGIFTAEERKTDAEKIWPSLQRLLVQGLKKAVTAKHLEGRKLSQDILTRLGLIRVALAKIEKSAAGQNERILKKLSERMNAILKDHPADPDRLAREAAFLAERSDITEEIVRMKSHLDLFKARLGGGAEIGRELDFLCQEMNREVNTLGSKAQLFEVATEVVFVKGELEKIREQIQNIE